MNLVPQFELPVVAPPPPSSVLRRFETFHPKITTTTDRYLVLELPSVAAAVADIESLGMELNSRTLEQCQADPETK